jgi:RNA polymerase sigma-70 factor (ECF subfamily)
MGVMEREEFLKSFVREQRLLAAYLLAATGDPHAAEDLLQGVAATLWQKLADYDQTRPFGAWATGVARLEVLRWRQQAARSREILSEESMRLLAEAAVRHAEEIDERYHFLAACLKALGETARRVLQMKYAEGRKIQEIAGCLGKRASAVEMVLVRGRRALRQCIEQKMAQAGLRAS